jgi:hypothetical protein
LAAFLDVVAPIFLIELATAIAAAATSAVALRGYRATSSPTFLRLTASFAFLAIGIAASSLSVYMADQMTAAIVLIFGSALEAVGYFVLALSHFFTVRKAIATTGALLLIPMASTGALVTLNLVERAVSFYLLVYISAETLFFYFQNRSRPTLISISGLLLITVGVTLDMFFFLTAPGYSIFFDAMKLLGFVILFSPVAIILRHRPEVHLS